MEHVRTRKNVLLDPIASAKFVAHRRLVSVSKLNRINEVFSRPSSIAPTCSDGVQNGQETDADCGGGICPACIDLRKCLTGSNCLSINCGSAKTCIGEQT